MSAHGVTPLAVPTSGADAPAFILVFGGTFDPPHVGHVELPRRVRDELERSAGVSGRGWIVYVPASRSPHKADAPIASDADRVAMLNLALDGVARAAVWTDEVDRSQRAGPNVEPSYSVQTLRRAREWLDDHGLSGVPLRLLIGADQALSFHKWRDPRDIMRLASPVVMVRSGSGADAAALARGLEATGFWTADALDKWASGVVNVGRIDVSATETRAALARGEWASAASSMHPDVLAYVRDRGLYVRRGS